MARSVSEFLLSMAKRIEIICLASTMHWIRALTCTPLCVNLLHVVPLPFASKPTKRSSFIIYMQDRFVTLKDDSRFQKPSKADPSKQSADVAAIARHVGEEWRSLDAASKQVSRDTRQKRERRKLADNDASSEIHRRSCG
jgi:hypothetical protein